MKRRGFTLAGALLAFLGTAWADTEPNNSIATAENATLGTLTGAMNTGLGDTEDYYRITLPDDGKVTINSSITSGDYNVQVALYNSDGASLGASSVSTAASLTVDCVAEGVIYVRIFRWSGATATYSLTTSLASPIYGSDVEPNNSLANDLQLVGVGVPRDGRLGYANGSAFPTDGDDYYRVILPGEGRVTLSAINDNTLNSIVYILDRDGNSRGGSSISTTPSLTVDCIGGDTLYLRVFRWSGCGSYRLTWTIATPLYSNDPEPNNTIATPRTIAPGIYRQGHLGYFNGLLYPQDANDYYVAIPAGDGKVTISAETDNGLLAIVYILNQDGSQLAGSSISATPSVTVDGIAQDTIYFRVFLWSGCGSYRVRYTLSESIYANDAEPNDNTGSAIAIAEDINYTGHLGYRNGAEIPTDANDFYLLSPAGDGRITATIETDNGLLAIIYLLNQDGSQIGGSAIGDSVSISVDGIAQGPVYARVFLWSGQGGYRIIYSLTEVPESNDTEPNDALAQATAISANFPAQGHIGYFNGSPAPVDNQDYYTFSGEAPGNITVTWNTSNGLNVILYLYNSVGSQLFGSSIGTSGSTVYNIPDAGTYYIRLFRWTGNGGYSVNLDNGCALPTSATEQIISVGARLQWQAVTGISSFNIRRGPNGGPFEVSTTSVKSSIWYPLTEATAYQWQVQSVCSTRVSGYIPLRSFTTLADPVCPPIAGLTESNLTSTSVDLTWNTTIVAIGYRVEYRVVGSVTGNAVNTSGGTVTLSGLLPSTNYEYRVIASCYGDGFSPYRNGTFSTPAARESNALEASVWPVPTENTLSFQCTLESGSSLDILVVDMMGRTVKTFREQGFAGTNRFDFNVAGLTSGLYHLQVVSAEGLQQVLPFGIR